LPESGQAEHHSRPPHDGLCTYVRYLDARERGGAAMTYEAGIDQRTVLIEFDSEAAEGIQAFEHVVHRHGYIGVPGHLDPRGTHPGFQ
jgi:hypothetical protein